MLCIAAEWLYLRLGCRSCRAQIFKVCWVHRGWMVLHVLDHIRCQQLPSMSVNDWLEKTIIIIFFQTAANYIVSQMTVWEISFPGGVGNDNAKWRTLIWAISESALILSVLMNRLPPKMYSGVFKFGISIMMLDFFLCVIWLPVGVSRTYGFRSAKDVFTMICTSHLNRHYLSRFRNKFYFR